jgi:hypothetical protein
MQLFYARESNELLIRWGSFHCLYHTFSRSVGLLQCHVVYFCVENIVRLQKNTFK